MAQCLFRALLLTLVCVCGSSYVQAQGIAFDSEATFLRLHRSNGIVFGDNTTDYEIGGRYQLSYVNSRNLGGRLTYWEWDHTARNVAGASIAAFRTYNADAEVFKRLDLTNLTNLEISGGIRYNESTNSDFAFGTTNQSIGWGGLFGIRGAVKTRLGGELYARSKWAVIMGDGTTFGALPNAGFDLVRNQWSWEWVMSTTSASATALSSLQV